MKLRYHVLGAVLFIFNQQSVLAGDIYWYVAASLAKPASAISKQFNSSQTQHKLYMIAGGSGQLLSKIHASQKGDLYTPASKFFRDKAKAMGIVLESEVLLKQTPVFGLSNRGRNKHLTYRSLTQKGVKIGLGNSKTMALGRTYLEIEKKMDAAFARAIRKNMVINAINVSQIINYLKTGAIDAGIIYDTVATANGLDTITIPKDHNQPEHAYLMTLAHSRNKGVLTHLVQYILKQKEIMKRFGFHV